MRMRLIQFLVFCPEDSLETLAEESEQFGGRVEPQLVTRVNFLHPAFKVVLSWFAVPSESNHEGRTHNDARV